MGDVMAVCPLCGETYYHVNGHNCEQPIPAHVHFIDPRIRYKVVNYFEGQPDVHFEPNCPYGLLLARLMAIEADMDELRERVQELEAELHEAQF